MHCYETALQKGEYRPMTHRGWLVAAAIVLLAHPAAAQFRVPDCATLADWAQGADRRQRWEPNAVGGRAGILAHYLTPRTGQVFGKPVLEWTVEESRSLDRPFLDCAQASRANRELMAALQGLRISAVNEIPTYLTARQQAGEAVAAAAAALAQAQPSLPLLAFYAALSAAGRDMQGYQAAAQRAAQVPGPAQPPARALVTHLRTLPTEEIASAVAPLAARTEAMRDAVQQGLIAEIGTVPASLPGLQALERFGQAVRQSYAAALGPERVRALDQAMLARRTAIGGEMTAAMTDELGRVADGPDAFAEIDRIADERVLRVLTEAQAGQVRTLAAARRKALAEQSLVRVRRELAALANTEASLDVIDQQVLPGIRAWPASVNDEKPRFEEAAAARRSEIVTRLNRAESGALRGRTYEGGGIAFEFVDRTRVFVKSPLGQTLAGTYAEERDGRVVVTLNNESLVLAREGKRLVGGPATLTRTK
jgi:hypothetical protein